MDIVTDYSSQDDTPESRRQKVAALCKGVKADIEHWEYAFKRMREWRDFARGIQWPGDSKATLSDAERRYVANVTMRHLKQRTASIYAKNPTYNWRRSKRMNHQVWDGTAQQLQMAQALIQGGMDPTGEQMRIVMDAMQAKTEGEMAKKIGETLTALYSYFMREQTPPTKKMMKWMILRSLTCGVAYIKQTFQRATDLPPDTRRALQDHMTQLAKMERMAAEMQEGEITQDDPEMEELRLMIQSLENQPHIILREGLALDYPDSTNIIPDRNMTYLPGFLGCSYVTEQYCLTPAQVREVYGVKMEPGSYTEYIDDNTYPSTQTTGGGQSDSSKSTVRVWEIWHREDNLVYTVCDGYHDFLEEPHEPITYTERFFPWFVYAPNSVDDPSDPFPPSDVELMMPQQMEINRAGEALRQHRFAARPGWVTGSAMPEEDVHKIESRKAHSLMVLKSLTPEDDVRQKFQPFPTSPIDMNLYQTSTVFADILRSVGTQEANLGGASGATATETSIAESSRQSTLTSANDEFDELLTEMARAGGQILIMEMSQEKVVEIVGRGAVWPEATREDVAREIHLEVQAGSSGRPNQAQEAAIIERLYPLLFQIPGLSPEKLGKHAVRVVDDSAPYEDWIDMSQMPIMALNGQLQAQANGQAGASQGPEGGNNAPRGPGQSSGAMPSPGQSGMGMPNTGSAPPEQ